ncbi:MAG: hypothetical protein L0215_11335 [Gemmataceae bacterium]|nr:hypothetical protein [Gemmataceae bacterium]
MTKTSSENLFRQAAEEEGGLPISAGARVAHVRLAIESGRTIQIDLFDVPEDKRTALIAEIKELVRRAGLRATSADVPPASEAAKDPG